MAIIRNAVFFALILALSAACDSANEAPPGSDAGALDAQSFDAARGDDASSTDASAHDEGIEWGIDVDLGSLPPDASADSALSAGDAAADDDDAALSSGDAGGERDDAASAEDGGLLTIGDAGGGPDRPDASEERDAGGACCVEVEGGSVGCDFYGTQRYLCLSNGCGWRNARDCIDSTPRVGAACGTPAGDACADITTHRGCGLAECLWSYDSDVSLSGTCECVPAL